MVRTYQLAVVAMSLMALSLAMPICSARGPHGGDPNPPPNIPINHNNNANGNWGNYINPNANRDF